MNRAVKEKESSSGIVELGYKNVVSSGAYKRTHNITVSDYVDTKCSDFVRSIPDARLCHLPEWTTMIEDIFGHKGHYLVARDNGIVCGILPLTHIRSRLFGSRLISQPFSDYGGPLVWNAAATDALYKRAVELAINCDCETIELRNTAVMPYEMHLRTDKVCMHLPLASDSELVWKGLRPQIRNRIRQAEKSGITITNGGYELLNDFYRLWTIRMRELGTPCYSRKLFSAILNTFPSNSRIFLAHSNGQVAAALLALAFNDCAFTRWGAALREYDSLSPNYLLNWSAVEFYCRAEIKWFDFGRCTAGSGQYTFKKRWGAKKVQLNWQYWTRPGCELSLPQQDSPKYKKKVDMWKKLPLWATRLIGPVISRSLP